MTVYESMPVNKGGPDVTTHYGREIIRLACLDALRELSKHLAVRVFAADNLYRRIELAAQVLSDLDWIVREHGGSDLKAQDALQSEFFRDLGGFVSLGKLTAMYRAVPKEQWAAVRYDVAAVEVIYDDRVEAQGDKSERKRVAWKALAEEREEQIGELKRTAAMATELAQRRESETTELRARVAQLERENERLLGRIEELERVSRREFAAV